jgi:phosphatidylinositol alpha 1,6-mannosyltransferase
MATLLQNPSTLPDRFDGAGLDALALQAQQRRLRVALFSGNFNYHRDGANMTLGRLVGFLVRLGIPVRVYSPTAKVDAFPPAGPLVSVPSWPIPRRPEYRFAYGMPAKVRADLDAFGPSLIHLSSPDLLGRAAQRYAAKAGVPQIASYHTRFESYLGFYGLDWLEPTVMRYLHRFYSRCQQLLVTTDGMAAELREAFGHPDIRLMSRGVDRSLYDPARRSPAWRLRHGISGEDLVIGFTGRLVLEKGLDQLVAVAQGLEASGIAHRLLIVGDGPERARLAQKLPRAIFAGFLSGEALATAYANMDVFYNPSTTETFGNVTLEAMASGVPVVAVRASGSEALVLPGITGLLVDGSAAQLSVDKLVQLGHDLSVRQSMSQAARAQSGSYDWDEILASVVRNYLDALPQPA